MICHLAHAMQARLTVLGFIRYFPHATYFSYLMQRKLIPKRGTSPLEAVSDWAIIMAYCFSNDASACSHQENTNTTYQTVITSSNSIFFSLSRHYTNQNCKKSSTDSKVRVNFQTYFSPGGNAPLAWSFYYINKSTIVSSPPSPKVIRKSAGNICSLTSRNYSQLWDLIANSPNSLLTGRHRQYPPGRACWQ